MFPLLFFFIFNSISLSNSLNDEGLALLSFKKSIQQNSAASYLDNWNSSDTTPCSWHGIECRSERVISLRIPEKGISGFLRLDPGKLVALRQVNLRNNNLTGSLPVELFNATALTNLVLSGNSFSGSVPSDIGNLKGLKILDLSQNYLVGSLPSSLLHCKKLRQLYLNSNNFSGFLPDGFGSDLVMLQKLDLSFNKLSGSIPFDFGNLRSLTGVLDLSNNLFNGTIPASLEKLSESVYINLSYNNLSGLIPQNDILLSVGPTAFIGNPFLCGLPLKSPCPMNPKPVADDPVQTIYRSRKSSWSRCVVIGIIASTMLGISLMVLLLSYWYKYKRGYVCKSRKHVEGCNSNEKSLVRKEMFCFRTDDLESLTENMEQYIFMTLDSQVKFDLEQLLKASAFLLGKTRVGIVYKVVIEKGPTVAVRRLEDGGSQRYREFQTEVEAISKIRHPNIVGLLAYCWCITEKLLIYDYLPNGDLAAAIHGMIYFKPLSWSIRLKIMRGVAKGLTFLHEFTPKRYVHGNLKPSNILLGENLEPCISDFGLGRLANTTEESASVSSEQTTNGTPLQGSPFAFTPINSSAVMSYYEAPEVSQSSKPSQKWDVYSFGVILLEMISGKSPVIQTSSSEMGLVQWIQLSTEVKPLSDVIDPFLVYDTDKKEEMVAVLKIALACVHLNPDKRPPMRNVSDSLEKLA
ncbi:probable inactive leucine-rich repeat receptor-like protein kinase At1g66830 isoform X2 [Mercurialis annua]|uniref:probable inactive leucine-rich repeat receptor-like protein kinase At1g66830 isoform X2 n=1 Tax=Mercurialis annua TaxID=3986 RepID=UPI00215E84CC|nr:probable inactive leucine-rich repeat receptor-like protein kinase At1g66830 isoform X2 [Mercurialis annua]